MPKCGILSKKLCVRLSLPSKIEATAQKLNLFKAGAATVLFFEDQDVVKGLQEQFPSYAANFPIWADQANAMVQYAVWTTLAAAGIGANLQHYNPLPDAALPKNGTCRKAGYCVRKWCWWYRGSSRRKNLPTNRRPSESIRRINEMMF